MPDISIKIFSHWWSRNPIDWQLKEIEDSKLILITIQKDKERKIRQAKEAARRRRMMEKKLAGEVYIVDEDEGKERK